MISCSIGIMAFNEAENIGRLLNALCYQEMKIVTIRKIVIVSSGSTDGTDDIVKDYSRLDSRIELITQPCREGKASAINCFLRSVDDEIIVLESADTIPTPTTIEELVSLFANPQVGMVGGHPVPVNKDNTFLGFGVQLLWGLHHHLCLHHPKMGELIAFRNIFRHIPNNTAVDEASIEPLIVGQGLILKYSPNAIVYNRGPDTITDYIKQRRRIYSGHIYVKETLGYQVATLNGFRIFWIYLSFMKFFDWRYWFWGSGMIILEIFCRTIGYFDYKVLRKNPFIWSIAKSTKKFSRINK